jgi:REP element-mobilizing transposase RayT
MQNSPKGWHSRGYLPHFDGEESLQFVTFRLSDSLPKTLLQKWKFEFERDRLENIDVELRKKIELYLDQGYGSCFLRKPSVANIIQDALLYLDNKNYKLIAWVIMPNHVHFLAKILPGNTLGSVMKVLKGFTAREVNRSMSRKGKFWQEDYFDRYIRDENHYFATISYIESNPVKAGLCKSPEDWPYSSARFKNVSIPKYGHSYP